MSTLHEWFPHLKSPVIVSAPMRGASGANLTAAVTNAGGLGFLGAGWDYSGLTTLIQETLTRLEHPPSPTEPLPIGVGFLIFKGGLQLALASIVPYRVSAIWLFGAKDPSQLQEWISTMQDGAPWAKIFVQVGSPEEARVAVGFGADAIVVQGGADAGGHGLREERGSCMVLVPEVLNVMHSMKKDKIPILAAGGIVDGRGVASVLSLGAEGAVMGSRLLLAEESECTDAQKEYIKNITSGPLTTVRTRLYDDLRETSFWPEQYEGRAYRNESYKEYEEGVGLGELKAEYAAAEKAQNWDRLTVFVGTAVGMINTIEPTGKILEDAREQAKRQLQRAANLINFN
ncbi:NPD-domain-containing protein [Ascobolus immersus RN42]|uniref:NPD-domain-containing protein n=1 Tax=Ascobolus immersus RN42 TaxID=1160509 RepID=A0A3N4I9Z6_ASCIM|nr:NPD-domain-containing protein [Ascobolus immersus RN42]